MVEHHLAKVGVASSNLVFRSIWGLSSDGRAPALHAGGQRFDPARLHQFYIIYYGGLAQLARASGSYPGGRGFDPLGRHNPLEVYPSLAEGIGLENQQAGQTARGFESLYLLHFYF